jgi:translation initiation factor IF-1
VEALELNEWTARNGQVRRYVNNWTRIMGLDYDCYNTGNIRAATVNGEAISNAACRRILGAKVWLDADDTVHVDYWAEHYAMTAAQVKETVERVYTEQNTASKVDSAGDQPRL